MKLDFLGCLSKNVSNSEDIEIALIDQRHTIGHLVNNIKLLDDIQFKVCYKHYHAEKDLQTLFDTAEKVLVSNKSIKDGVDYGHLENFMDTCWNLEKEEHSGNEAEAYNCFKRNISDKELHGWVVNHVPEGRGFLG